MKKIEVASFSIDELLYIYQPSVSNKVNKVVDVWLNTEEGKFVKQHSLQPLETVWYNDAITFITNIKVFAVLDEDKEIFWRLKFK